MAWVGVGCKGGDLQPSHALTLTCSGSAASSKQKMAKKSPFSCISHKISLPLRRKISAIKDEQDYVKADNYWRWLKKKLASQGFQPVSALTTSNSKLD